MYKVASVIPMQNRSKATKWNGGVTPVTLEPSECNYWELRPTIGYALDRLWPDRAWHFVPEDELFVVRITISAPGLIVMARDGILEIMQFPHRNMGIHSPLHQELRTRTGKLLYTVSNVAQQE